LAVVLFNCRRETACGDTDEEEAAMFATLNDDVFDADVSFVC